MITTITRAIARKREALANGEKQKGFTLIELLVVVLIIGVLAAVAIPIFLNQQEGAKDSAVAAQITQAKTAVAVELAKGGTVQAAITKLTAGTLDSYTTSTDVQISATAGTAPATTFTILGMWGTTYATAASTNHGYRITDATAAVKL